MKSYTDLEQSKKLVEILLIESADMWYGKKPVLKVTHQKAMKWLREEKNIIVNVWYNGVDWSAEYYNNEDENFYLITDCLSNSYEEAVEAALMFSLVNLI